MMQKPEGFRVKASEGEVVVFTLFRRNSKSEVGFEPSARQNLKFSGFPELSGVA